MAIHESAENYLETILILSKTLPYVRSIDISEKLNFKKSSISIAMKNLRENNYIIMDNKGYITLTEAGKKIAEMIYERHKILTAILMNLGVDEVTASEDACKIEHDISEKSFEAIKNHIKSDPAYKDININ